MKTHLHYFFKADLMYLCVFPPLYFDLKGKRRIHNQLLFCYLHSSASTEVYCWKELGKREVDRRKRRGGESRGKEKSREKPKESFCIFAVPHLSTYWQHFLPGGIALSRKSQNGCAQPGMEDSGRTPSGVASQPFFQQEGSMLLRWVSEDSLLPFLMIHTNPHMPGQGISSERFQVIFHPLKLNWSQVNQ